MAFLKMVKLKEGKLKWALRQKDCSNAYLASMCSVGVRRFQQLKAHYHTTGEIPKLKRNRRPAKPLTAADKELIEQAVRDSKLCGAVTLRLYIQKYHGKTLARNKLHQHLLETGVSTPDKKKQKQRKYCRYERKHSFSLGHMDYHDSKVIPGKYVLTWQDDASRNILGGGEFDAETTENAMKVVRQAQKKAASYNGILLALNTDRGSQFFANTIDQNGRKAISQFEIFLAQEGIQHIPSRRNHPQTNGKEERWFRTYEENRLKFQSFDKFIAWYNDRIHLGLSRTEGITPNEAITTKLRPECWLGLYHKLTESK